MAPLFEDKIILITGAGSGIGRATSIKLSSLGATLALQDINPSSLTETQTLCSSKQEHFTSAFDVGSTSSVNKFVASIIDKHGRIDHVFNCAGVNPTTKATEDVTDEYWDKLMNTNLKGMFNITRASIPHIPSHSGSTMVNVSSVVGLSPVVGFAVYCASKYGVIGFSKCIALELGSRGVRVNVVAPGSIDTPTNASVVAGKESVEESARNVSMGRMGTAEEVADVVAWLMGRESGYVNGSVVEVTGGLLKGL